MSNAPRVTQEDVQNAIREVMYVVLPDGRTTICMLTLDNGFTVRGESSCVCAENFDPDIGQSIAYKDAQNKVWPLLGFRLADRIQTEQRGPVHRDAGTGQFVSEEYAAANPATTVTERS